MTEYKKLCALVAQLQEEITVLTSAFEAGDEHDPNALHASSLSIQTLIANAQPRLVKILRKAIETDPNRQIYNEKMCTAIRQLFDDFCETVSDLFGVPMNEVLLSEEEKPDFEECPSISWAEGVYNCHLLRLAQTEGWKKRIARNMTDLVIYEEETRTVYCAEEKKMRDELLQAKKREKTSIQQLLREREQAKWEAEVRRREEEHQRLVDTSRSCGTPSNISTLLLNIPEPLRKSLVGNLLQLAEALCRTPENPNIRQIRCNNRRVMMEYGHVALCCECEACQIVVSSAEVLWYMMGYQVDYSTAPTSSLSTLIESNPPILLPCGRQASEHVVRTIGFEDYSERFFILHEPDPAQMPNEWMVWYATLESMIECLKGCLV